MKNYINRVGETVGSLRVNTILRYENGEPVYGCACSECGSHMPIPHRAFRYGNARCISSSHGRPSVEPGPTLAHAATVEITASARQKQEGAIHKQPVLLHPLVEAEIARRDAIRDAERQSLERQFEKERLQADADYRSYCKHAVLEWGYTPEELITRVIWYRIGDLGRERILRRIEEENAT